MTKKAALEMGQAPAPFKPQSDQQPSDNDKPSSQEVADYIIDMLRDLRAMAHSTGLISLSAILELAERGAKRD